MQCVTKNHGKRIGLLLTMLVFVTLLSLSAVLMTVAAQPSNDGPELKIEAHALSLYQKNVYVKYAVSVENAEAEDVKLLIWTAGQPSYTYGTQQYEASVAYTEEVGGKTCLVFQYPALRNDQMTDVVYARVCVKVGGEYHYSAMSKYSVLQYAYNMRVKGVADQELLDKLEELLDKGAEAQLASGYRTDDLANEEHCLIHVVDDTMADGFADGLHPSATPITGIERYMVSYGVNTYYIENNITVINCRRVIENYVYYFDIDGLMVKDDVVEGYEYGPDGYMIGDRVLVVVEGDTYCIVNNVVVIDRRMVLNNYVYYFGSDGGMCQGGEDADGNEYNDEGHMIGDHVLVIVEGDTYCVVNNLIVINCQIIVNNHIYYFDFDGTMCQDREGPDGNYYDENGHLSGDSVLVVIEGDTYCIVNNVYVTNSQMVINNYIYYFGEDGVMCQGGQDSDGNQYDEDGHLVGDRVTVIMGGNTYYIVNNMVVYNYYVIVNNYVYYFGSDGCMNRGECDPDGNYYDSDGRMEGDRVLVVVEGDTYCVVNNVIAFNYQVVINNYVYYFGEDGCMCRDEQDPEGNYYGPDGGMTGDHVTVIVEGNTYYIVNNMVMINYQAVINNHVYYFGSNGCMCRGEHDPDGNYYDPDGRMEGDRVLVVVEGDTYYVINNVIVFNYQVVINNYVYYFGEDGCMSRDEHDPAGNYYGPDGGMTGDRVLVVVEGNTYYIVNNVIMVNYQVVINNYVYYFGGDGCMCRGDRDPGGNRYDDEGHMVGDSVFVVIEGNTYYVVNNVIVVNYQIINNVIYYFGTDGVMVKDQTVGDHTFDANGHLTTPNTTVNINGDVYVVVDGVPMRLLTVAGTIYESDSNLDLTDNALLGGVLCTLEVNGETYTMTTEADGSFLFENVPFGTGVLTFEKDGYVTVVLTEDFAGDTTKTIVMDRDVSNTLMGRLTVADADMNLSNNYGLGGAQITLRRISSTNVLEMTTTTDSNGYYTFYGLTAGVYEMCVAKDGYITVNQTVCVKYNETTVQNIQIEVIPASQVNPGYASGTATDARTGSSISNLIVYIREGINNTTGEILMTLTTDAYGRYTTDALTPGNYTAQFVDNRELVDEDYRYGTGVLNMKVMSDCTISNQNITMSNQVGLSVDGFRVVLTWGSSPSDLDSHMQIDLTNGYSAHIDYSHKNDFNTSLDVDDTTSYGPETITVSSVGEGTYCYYIFNWSRGSYSELSNSGATVKVYLGASSEAAYTFYVPQGSGYYWNVFTYNSVTGEFIIENTIS